MRKGLLNLFLLILLFTAPSIAQKDSVQTLNKDLVTLQGFKRIVEQDGTWTCLDSLTYIEVGRVVLRSEFYDSTKIQLDQSLDISDSLFIVVDSLRSNQLKKDSLNNIVNESLKEELETSREESKRYQLLTLLGSSLALILGILLG